MINDTSYLQDWVFHYNDYTKAWAAIPRDLYNEYWSDYSHPKILRSKRVETLIELIHKSKGKHSIIKQIVNAKNK